MENKSKTPTEIWVNLEGMTSYSLTKTEGKTKFNPVNGQWYNYDIKYLSEQSVLEMLAEKDREIDRLKSEIPQWISVKDKLPNNIASVILFGKNIRSTGIYMEGEFFSDFKLPQHKDITHWMEIPKQP